MEKASEKMIPELLEIIRKMTLSLDTDTVLEHIVESVAKLAQARNSSLILIDEKTNEFHFRAVYGEKSENVKIVSFPSDQGIAGWVVKEKKPLLVEDVSKDQRFNKSVDIETGFKTKSIICVPMEIKGRIIGVLEVLNSENEQTFSSDQFEILLTFARQAAIAIENSKLYTEAIKENAYLHNELGERYRLLSSSQVMNDVLSIARSAAQSDSTILISGESGTGKELLARSIHNVSPRSKKPFIAVNCAALSEELLESDLFGHEKGSFTGAHIKKQGKLKVADKGTVFLDEIGELKLSLQAKLLRVLQEHTFETVGGTETVEVDIRVICATNRDLNKAVSEGVFRADLFYRLNVIPVKMPPLRERKDEIVALSKFFVERYCSKTGQRLKTISDKAINCLIDYNWPGNVRELENIIERAVVLERGDVISTQHFYLTETVNIGTSASETPETENESMGYRDRVKVKKREIIKNAILKSNGNQAKAAKLLDIQPSYLSRLLVELEIKN